MFLEIPFPRGTLQKVIFLSVSDSCISCDVILELQFLCLPIEGKRENPVVLGLAVMSDSGKRDWLWLLQEPHVQNSKSWGGQNRVVTDVLTTFANSKHVSYTFQWIGNGNMYFVSEQKPLKVFWKNVCLEIDKFRTFWIFLKRFSDVGQMLLFADLGLCRMT